MIGTHFNSKLGDGNLWGVNQPLNFLSEDQRSLIGKKVNQFVGRLLAKDPNANVIVTGDMNAYWNEVSMEVLAGKVLVNLMTHEDLVPKDQWYSTNYNGGTAAIIRSRLATAASVSISITATTPTARRSTNGPATRAGISVSGLRRSSKASSACATSRPINVSISPASRRITTPSSNSGNAAADSTSRFA